MAAQLVLGPLLPVTSAVHLRDGRVAAGATNAIVRDLFTPP